MDSYTCRADQPHPRAALDDVTTPNACARICDGDPSCRSFWFDATTKQCTLVGADASRSALHCVRVDAPRK